MANYKVPRHVEIVSALPMNAAGKVQKFALRGDAGALTRSPRSSRTASHANAMLAVPTPASSTSKRSPARAGSSGTSEPDRMTSPASSVTP